MPVRAGFYIDGFNFYHAVNDLGQPHLKWMSYARLAEALLNRDESVAIVRFFSALATHRPASMARHVELNAALRAEGVDIVLGQFKGRNTRCKACGAQWKHPEEKESDVNVALHLLDDCYRGLIDVAYIVSTDSDIAPAARMVRQRLPHIQLVTVSTPGRSHSKEMLSVCQRKARATQALVEACLLPEKMFDSDGDLVATRPAEYSPPVY